MSRGVDRRGKGFGCQPTSGATPLELRDAGSTQSDLAIAMLTHREPVGNNRFSPASRGLPLAQSGIYIWPMLGEMSRRIGLTASPREPLEARSSCGGQLSCLPVEAVLC